MSNFHLKLPQGDFSNITAVNNPTEHAISNFLPEQLRKILLMTRKINSISDLKKHQNLALSIDLSLGHGGNITAIDNNPKEQQAISNFLEQLLILWLHPTDHP